MHVDFDTGEYSPHSGVSLTLRVSIWATYCERGIDTKMSQNPEVSE